MYENLLPIGSIVKLEGAEKKVMVCGRIAVEASDNEVFDYIGCVYPIGIASEDEYVFFNREAIERTLFIGFQDEEELIFRSEILAQLGDLTVE